ncbi:hypothetical protein HPB48_006203 [Haemaphysalis longicornis]|uniref:PH domain-containing protein n=1 Tax=Haemaphysalis longicornis TaxID=44386 RepID=A0A9J6FVJ6_HAELO|nr:hypothetical protein HPB48_006203 [Haemaphysalis longicornis]
MASDKGDCSGGDAGVIALPNESRDGDDSPPSALSPPTTSSRSTASGGVQLCGYLNKLSSRSLVKVYRRRWFAFLESNCKLYYYREPDDVNPLGEIDIKSASFYPSTSRTGRNRVCS